MQDPTTALFQLALGLTPPWQIDRLHFDSDHHRLDIHLGFPRGSRFACPEGDAPECPVHDTTDKEWRHLNFFQHEAYLHAPVPRVRCPEHGVRQVVVPWTRPGSSFTLLFEALAMLLMREMPVRAAARILGEHDTKLWRVLLHYVDKARRHEDFADVNQLGVDETSHRRGHDYVSLFVDLDRTKVLFATPGRDHATVGRFKADFVAHGGRPDGISDVCLDMSEPFMLGLRTNFPAAQLTFDKYHIMQLLNRAVDLARRDEQLWNPHLKKSRYLWLKRDSALSGQERQTLERLRRRCRQTARAYEFKLEFQEFWEQEPAVAAAFLDDWCDRVSRTRMRALEALRTFVGTVDDNWDGILRWFESRINNGVLEAINSLVQAAKRRARGYRNDRHFIAMIYMTAGKLNFGLPT